MPFPCPDAGVTSVTHGASFATVHAHSGVVTTSMVSLPPAASTLAVDELSVKPHLLTEGLGELNDEDEQEAERPAARRIP